KLILQAKIMYDYKVKTEGAGWSTQYYQNHNWINMTGLAAAGYALIDEYPQAEEFINISKQNFEKVYKYLADDGSNYEGVAYWRYGGMWLFVYPHLLRSAEGIDYFKSSNYLRNTFYYRLYQSTGNLLHPLNFGDCHDYYSSHCPAVYYTVASEYNDGYAQTLANKVLDKYLYQEALESHVKPGILFEAGLEFLWYNPKIEEKDIQSLTKSRYFPDLGLLYIRNTWKEDAVVFSIKCSAPGGFKQWNIGWEHYDQYNHKVMSLSHHHPDNLSYILNRKNIPLLIDEGYNREAKPDHHNGVMVDNKIFDVEEKSDIYMHSIFKRLSEHPEYNPVKGYLGEVEIMEVKDGLFLYKGNNHLIYQLDLNMEEVSRTVLSNNLEYLLVIDYLKSKDFHNYTLVNNTLVKPIINSNKASYQIGLNALEISFFSDQKLSYTLDEILISTIFTPQEPDIIKREYLQSLKAEAKNSKETTFLQLINYGDLESKNDIRVINKSKAGLIELEITDGKWTDYYFEGKIVNNFVETDGSNLYLRFENNTLIDLILINASYLSISGKQVHHSDRVTNLIRSKYEVSK
ncbi:MAG: hypothetical protein PHX62_08690, partial [Bacilli bacterium]|nr:hypothetical protein [Bacilli bacterium]